MRNPFLSQVASGSGRAQWKTFRLVEVRPVRHGVWKCRDCSKQLTVTVGTIFQSSKILLSKWVTAIYLVAESANPMNTLQLHELFRLTYMSADLWVKRLGPGMRQGRLGRKLHNLLG